TATLARASASISRVANPAVIGGEAGAGTSWTSGWTLGGGTGTTACPVACPMACEALLSAGFAATRGLARPESRAEGEIGADLRPFRDFFLATTGQRLLRNGGSAILRCSINKYGISVG